MVKSPRSLSLFTILLALLLPPPGPAAAQKSAAPAKNAPGKPPAAPTKKPPAAAAKQPPAAAAKKPSSTQAKSGTASKSKGKTTARRGRSRGRTQIARRPTRPGQKVPTPDRVKEIQGSLRAKGYEVQPTGAWDKQSEAAMKKFQQDQNLEGNGKLTALSLIALGLGPKHEPAPANPPPPAPVPGKD
jgi:hypothetical protein